MSLILLALAMAWVMFTLHNQALDRKSQWDEEEKRQQMVKDLYPEQPSYEERMGVHYGKTDKDDNNG